MNRFRYSYRGILFFGILLYVSLQLLEIMIYFALCIYHGQGMEPINVLLLIKGFPGLFISILLPVHFALFIMVGISNIVLIRHENFHPGRLFGAAVTFSYFAGSLFLELLTPHIIGRYPEFLMLMRLLMCYADCTLFGVCVMGALAAGHRAAYDKDYVIILGCSISKNGGLRPVLKERTNRAIHFAWEQEIATGKKVLYVPSGGKGSDEIISEGSAMELYLASHGAEFDEIYPEKNSRNTYENMKFSKEITDSLKPDARIAFVTTNYHVLRSGMYAGRAGLDAEGVGCRSRWYFWPNGFAREYIAILSMYPKVHLAALLVALGCFVISFFS